MVEDVERAGQVRQDLRQETVEHGRELALVADRLQPPGHPAQELDRLLSRLQGPASLDQLGIGTGELCLRHVGLLDRARQLLRHDIVRAGKFAEFDTACHFRAGIPVPATEAVDRVEQVLERPGHPRADLPAQQQDQQREQGAADEQEHADEFVALVRVFRPLEEKATFVVPHRHGDGVDLLHQRSAALARDGVRRLRRPNSPAALHRPRHDQGLVGREASQGLGPLQLLWIVLDELDHGIAKRGRTGDVVVEVREV